jgi:hypothetical protein
MRKHVKLGIDFSLLPDSLHRSAIYQTRMALKPQRSGQVDKLTSQTVITCGIDMHVKRITLCLYLVTVLEYSNLVRYV